MDSNLNHSSSRLSFFFAPYGPRLCYSDGPAWQYMSSSNGTFMSSLPLLLPSRNRGLCHRGRIDQESADLQLVHASRKNGEMARAVEREIFQRYAPAVFKPDDFIGDPRI